MKMLFWNLHGPKNVEEEGWRYMREFDVVGLTETWFVEKRENEVKKKFKGYKVLMAGAIKEKGKRGRPKGGVILAIRKDVVEEFYEEEDFIRQEIVGSRVKIEGKEWKIAVTYMREKRGENWRKIEEWSGEDPDVRVVVGGDFNARIGIEGGWLDEQYNEEMERKSQDLTKDKEGEEMLEHVRNFGLEILNGNIKGDELGKLTCFAPRGRSVNDYVLANREGLQEIERMVVEERMESDHMPLEVTLKMEIAKKEKQEWIERADWSEAAVKGFKKKLSEGKKAKGWSDMRKKVNQAITRKKVRMYEEKEEEEWWDEDCRKKRAEVWKRFKKSMDRNEEKEGYYKARREYRELLSRKRLEAGKRIIKEIVEDKTQKTLWKKVNGKRNKREKIEERIKDVEWLEHFKKQFGGEDIQEDEEDEEDAGEEGRVRRRKEGVEEIKKEEVEGAIKRLKKKKASGPDGIQNEAWIFGVEEVIEELTEILNEIWKGGEVPKEWREGNVIPIYKKGDKEKVENYRGITLMDTGYKIYAEILRRRLEEYLEKEEKLSDTQMGFRRRRGTVDAIYILKTAIGREIEKEEGKVFAFFADMKGAFDNIKREELWRMMEELEVEENLRWRIEDLYEKTVCNIITNGKEVGRFETKKGVRQGCPLSPTAFNVDFADLEEEMAKEQEGGIVLGRKKFWSIAYADDVALVATSVAGLKAMVRRFERYLKKKGLELNVNKSKVMAFRKESRGRKKKMEIKWKGEEIEQVNSFIYLGYTLKENNGDEGHIRNVAGKAKAVMGRIWSLGERLMGEQWQLKMKLFDTMVKSIVMYGAEVWGWRGYKELESIHERFMRWTLRLDKHTPGYLIRLETKREKLEVKAGTRAVKFEEKLRFWRLDTLKGECLRLLQRNDVRSNMERERKKFFEERGWSNAGITIRMYTEESIWPELEARSVDLQLRERESKAERSNYAEEFRELILENVEMPRYLRDDWRKLKNETSTIARFRLGNESRASQYWREVQEKKCRMCDEERETLEHVVEVCEFTKKNKASWKEWLREEKKSLSSMNSILWKRKERRRKEDKIVTVLEKWQTDGNKIGGPECAQVRKKKD